MGQPSATTVWLSPESIVGGNGGMGHPSAIRLRSIAMGLPAERLTDRITGSNISTAPTETATANAAFFMGVSLLSCRMRRDSRGGVFRLEMFRLRNTARHANSYAAPAESPGRSGLHAHNSGGYSRTIRSPCLHRFVAGSFQWTV